MCCGNWDVFKWFLSKAKNNEDISFYMTQQRDNFYERIENFWPLGLSTQQYNQHVSTIDRFHEQSNVVTSAPAAPATKKLQHKFKVLNPQAHSLVKIKTKKGLSGANPKLNKNINKGQKCPGMEKKSIQHPHQLPENCDKCEENETNLN